MRGYEILRRHGVSTDILCVVSAANVRSRSRSTGFSRDRRHLPELPAPGREEQGPAGRVTPDSVRAEAWGDFLCAIFDEWVENDIGRIKVQIFEEAARTAFGQEHSLCIFRPTCGDIPVVERNGDFYSCDHYVDAAHRLGDIRETPLAALLESPAQRAFGEAKLDALPRVCRSCEVRAMCHGECPKNRFLASPDGEAGWNYLCAGYRRFFNHARPFVDAVAAEWRRGGLSLELRLVEGERPLPGQLGRFLVVDPALLSLKKACRAPSYMKSWYSTPAFSSASSKAGMPALIRSSSPAYWSSMAALILGTSSTGGCAP